MQHNPVSAAYVAAELEARERWDNHVFGEAASSAHTAATIARRDGDPESWWNMTFLQAESLLAAGQFEDCTTVAHSLILQPELISPQAKAQVHILKAKAGQGSGLLESAVVEARLAADLMQDEADLEMRVKALQALVGALADSGMLDEAWAECLNLADAISVEVDDQLVGKAYWVIGNVAFLCNKIQDGLDFHERAAATFSPARNLDVWAKFNKASAAMRLAADIADADTLRCIERAELATDIIGGSAEDHMLLRLNRGHWSYLAGEPAAAIGVLEGVCAEANSTLPQIVGEARLLLGRAHAALAQPGRANENLLMAAHQFEAAGASQRAQLARGFLSAEE
ncbi:MULTISPECIES: hypothetical protein [unclassified Arthrobacter]|uniref:hypothetical protein n=1 Tax=unclassified Arthrobacter TaxID=235627 RepID=UPI001CFF9E06|nr:MULTISPECIES: hypothetical protein [unclassified Arthrobacter]MCB5283851.1 hypothetical protein [Arthrobacter sp. ES1]WGZ80012.1 hypothetical protein QI450_01830 [Arthrobacter sp. EM1]